MSERIISTVLNRDVVRRFLCKVTLVCQYQKASATFQKFVFLNQLINTVLDDDTWYWKLSKSNEIFKNWPLFVFVFKYLFEVPATEVLTTVVTDIST